MDDYCIYHKCIDELVDTVHRHVGMYCSNGNGYLKPWLQGGSHFDILYLNKMKEYIFVPLPNQVILAKGRALEKSIVRWLDAEPDIPVGELQYQIEQFIRKQFKKEDLKDLFEPCSC